MPVYYWAEQAPVCQTILLTRADKTVKLSPAAPLRIRRNGKSQNLIVQPLAGATLFAASGQEASKLSIGDGIRVTARDTRGLTRAIAISIRQKPRRPAATVNEFETLQETGICGLLDTNGNVTSPAGSDEFDWGFDTTSANVG